MTPFIPLEADRDLKIATRALFNFIIVVQHKMTMIIRHAIAASNGIHVKNLSKNYFRDFLAHRDGIRVLPDVSSDRGSGAAGGRPRVLAVFLEFARFSWKFGFLIGEPNSKKLKSRGQKEVFLGAVKAA